jgi:tetratricopeptide (TPR) repeat protein
MFRIPVFSLIILFSLATTGVTPALVQEIDRQYESPRTTTQDLLQTESMILKTQEQAGASEALAWRLARTYYALAGRSRKEAAKKYYHRCLEQAEQTIALDIKSAWGFYLRGLCRGKLGEMQGVWSSLAMISPLKKDFKQAAKLDPSVSQGGPHRALGKLYLELPGLLGGNVDKSVDHLKQAVVLGPKYADNYLFLADALYEQENYLAAKNTLQDLLTIIGESDEPPNAHQIRQKVLIRITKIDPWIESQSSHAQ